MTDRIRQFDHLDGAGAVGQAADETALFQGRNKPVNPRLGAQVQGVLHLVEGRRNPGLRQALVDEAQELELLAGQHRFLPVGPGPHPRDRLRNKS